MVRRGAFKTANEQVSIAFNNTLLVHYTVAYHPDQQHVRAVTDPHIDATPYRSPQLALWKFGDAEWLKILRQPLLPARRKRQSRSATQQQWFTYVFANGFCQAKGGSLVLGESAVWLRVVTSRVVEHLQRVNHHIDCDARCRSRM